MKIKNYAVVTTIINNQSEEKFITNTHFFASASKAMGYFMTEFQQLCKSGDVPKDNCQISNTKWYLKSDDITAYSSIEINEMDAYVVACYKQNQEDKKDSFIARPFLDEESAKGYLKGLYEQCLSLFGQPEEGDGTNRKDEYSFDLLYCDKEYLRINAEIVD